MKLIDYIRQAPDEEVADIIGRVVCLQNGVSSSEAKKIHFNNTLKALRTDVEEIKESDIKDRRENDETRKETNVYKTKRQ